MKKTQNIQWVLFALNADESEAKEAHELKRKVGHLSEMIISALKWIVVREAARWRRDLRMYIGVEGIVSC